jgi:hypothetical protein
MLLEDVILPALTEMGTTVYQNLTQAEELCVPIALDAQAQQRTLIRVVLSDDTGDLQLWTEVIPVSASGRARMLEVLNRWNAELRWLKFMLVEGMVLVVVDVALAPGGDGCKQFQRMFMVYVDALQRAWPELTRTAARRGRRSRLEREVADLLAQQATDPTHD